jgi:hypothetical protein
MSKSSLRDESGGGAENALRLSMEHLKGHGYQLFSHFDPRKLRFGRALFSGPPACPLCPERSQRVQA